MRKAIYTLVAMLTAFAALAQTEGKALIVTLKDGTKKEYKLTDIDHLAFGEASLPVADPTTGPYAVGDFYSDGVNQGVVVTVDATGSYGTLAAVTDMPQPLCYSTTYEVTNASDEEYGPANMATVAAISPDYDFYPAFKACVEMGQGWYLPAQKELQTMRGALDAINATLTSRGFAPVSTEATYWSSTEADQYMDAMAYTALMDMPGMFAIQKQEVAQVRAFREFGEKPEPRFTVGKLYDVDNVKGIIYWVADDDSYARIISLTEASENWGELGKKIGAKSTESGDLNKKAADKADGTLESLPAFLSCAAQGEGWFLPAVAELKAIAGMKAQINAALAANGGTALADAYYWSSTEHAADGANSAMAVLLTDGSELASSKNVARNVRAVAYVGDRPADVTTFAVGDPYYEGDNVVGIVCEVSDDGTSGKIIALANVKEQGRINAMWDKRANSDNYVELGASSLDDGEANMAAARANDPELANLTAFRLCAELGDGWYLPAFNEMKAVADNKTDLNAALRANGGSTLDNDDYWTSTEGTENALERAKSVKISDGSAFDYRKYFYNKVRPMKKF